jgi:Cd2+/Zn2+-exporting ATPase
MTDSTGKLEIPIIVPGIEGDSDECLVLLLESLLNQKGIIKAHIDWTTSQAQICLHFDPNIITLAAIKRIAMEAGSDFNKRYRHEKIPFSKMDAADSAMSLKHVLENLPGMLHTSVNYAAGVLFVAYDTTILDREKIDREIRMMGHTPIETPLPVHKPTQREPQPEKEYETDRGLPALLPNWITKWRELILVIMAGSFLGVGWLGQTFWGMPAEISLGLFILSYLFGGYDIATHAIPGLIKGKFDTDVLMLAAAVGAALLGEWTEGAFLLFLFGLGHAGEHFALDRARNAVNELGSLMPTTAKVKVGEQIMEKDVDNISIDDVVLVRPGDHIPVDGDIIKGVSAIDESAITGESLPVEKQEGDEVFAGTINQESSLEVRVTKLAKDNTLSRVMQMVTEAQNQQSPTQQFTERFTAWFVPAVLGLVLLVFIVPPIFNWMTWENSFYRGMLLLVAASPCALAIGTPASVLAGIAQAARNGVLIKGGVHLENLGGLKTIAFDKTGTLTRGKFQITEIVTLDGHGQDEILSIAAGVEQQSNHPLALAIVESAKEKGVKIPTADGLENVPGRGVRSEIAGKEVLIGSLELFQENHTSEIPTEVEKKVRDLEASGKTTMTISHGEEFLGIIALADTPREGVQEMLGKLRQTGIEKFIMLTGDNERVARQIGQKVGVTDVRASLLPDEKLEAIKQIPENIAMVGDGVNDAPALATATVGIAMGGAGTAVALETADIALMADDLSKLPFAIGLSRASRKIIRQNLWISLGVIGLLILTSVLGWMQLSWAVVLHEGSTILVVLNALRLLGYRPAEQR